MVTPAKVFISFLCPFLSPRKSSGQRAALHQAEGEIHRTGSESCRPAEEGEEDAVSRSLRVLVAARNASESGPVLFCAERRGHPADDGGPGGSG